MAMYDTENKSRLFLLLFAAAASLLGWGVIKHYKPLLVKTSCSEISAKSSGIISSERYNLNTTEYSYDNLRRDCLKQSMNQ